MKKNLNKLMINWGKKIYPKLLREGAKGKNVLLFIIGSNLKKRIIDNEKLTQQIKELEQQKKAINQEFLVIRHELKKLNKKQGK